MGPNPLTLVPLWEEGIWADTRQEDHVKTQEEDGHLQAKGRGLRRNWPCCQLGLRLLASRSVSEGFLLLKPYCPWLTDSLSKLITPSAFSLTKGLGPVPRGFILRKGLDYDLLVLSFHLESLWGILNISLRKRGPSFPFFRLGNTCDQLPMNGFFISLLGLCIYFSWRYKQSKKPLKLELIPIYCIDLSR